MAADTAFDRDVRAVRAHREARTLTLPRTVEDIGKEPFRGLAQTKSLDMGRATEELGRRLEELHRLCGGCITPYSAARLVLPCGLREIGERCFAYGELRRFAVPSSVEVIGRQAFASCVSLRAVVFREDSRLREVRQEAFSDSGLEDFAAPASLRLLAQGAFYMCRSLRSAELNEGLEALGSEDGGRGVFCYSALERVRLPSTLRRIAAEAFQHSRLAAVALPEGLQSLGARCFQHTRVRSLTLPATLREAAGFEEDFCDGFEEVCLREGCALAGLSPGPGTRVRVVPSPQTLVGGVPFGALWGARDVVLPEDLEEVGAGWF